ncbi:YhcN/YlaJ family sporulation lipoprotein [Psychrobacillus sp. FJAT-51614]|uniref:YhcN/YlaJ family sporulation lipoprotein n=1 Tax=Psychrobacillus mangrovi TaxID=3117745 RepID=A0ABU8F9B1_9BACI
MSKILQVALTLLLISSLVGCGTANNNDNNANKNNDNNDVKTNDTVNTNTTNDETGTDTNDNNGTNGDQKLELADDVASKITELEEVDSANVIVTNNNAYVGVMLKEGTNDSEELEKKIADKARETNGNFDNVYVTTNPDFAKQITEYGDKIRANEPIEGLYDEFADTVKRVFPNAK